MNIATLLAAPPELRVESIAVTTMRITVRATAVKAQAACPTCEEALLSPIEREERRRLTTKTWTDQYWARFLDEGNKG
jgi:hypothetical protein